MCMEALPGPAELQAHFENVHDEGGGGGGGEEEEHLMDNGDEVRINLNIYLYIC